CSMSTWSSWKSSPSKKVTKGRSPCARWSAFGGSIFGSAWLMQPSSGRPEQRLDLLLAHPDAGPALDRRRLLPRRARTDGEAAARGEDPTGDEAAQGAREVPPRVADAPGRPGDTDRLEAAPPPADAARPPVRVGDRLAHRTPEDRRRDQAGTDRIHPDP